MDTMAAASEESSRPDVPGLSAVRALAQLCQRAGVHDLEASVGDWSIRLRLDHTAADSLPPQPAASNTVTDPDQPHVLLSDWVGVFRRALDLDKPALAQEGQVVREGEVIGLIEAMQLLHEQRVDRPGRIVRFLVEDDAPVEYGQPLLEMQ